MGRILGGAPRMTAEAAVVTETEGCGVDWLPEATFPRVIKNGQEWIGCLRQPFQG